jgi:ABC-type sugar transport system permease subunit
MADTTQITPTEASPKKTKRFRLSYERKKALYGFMFIGLWLIGTVYMFLIPLGESFYWSLSDTELVGEPSRIQELGMSGPGMYTEWNNFKHYIYMFNQDPNYSRNLVDSLMGIGPSSFMILLFSLFIAIMLNQKFRGRTLARAIFFLPVLIATGPVISVINGNMLSQGISEASQFSSLFQTDFVQDFMAFMGIYNISEQLGTQISQLTSNIFNLVWSAGIQILIFLSALQQIPVSAKEAAAIEGATGWEFFWKITFPSISPMILASLIYTVIDAFISVDNPVMKQVIQKVQAWEYGYSAAMAWVYFLIVATALGILVAIISRYIFYQVD